MLDELIKLAEKQFLHVHVETYYTGKNLKVKIELIDHSPTAQPGYEFRTLYNDTGYYAGVIELAYLWLLAKQRGYRLTKVAT